MVNFSLIIWIIKIAVISWVQKITIAPKKYLYQSGHAIWWYVAPKIINTFWRAMILRGKRLFCLLPLVAADLEKPFMNLRQAVPERQYGKAVQIRMVPQICWQRNLLVGLKKLDITSKLLTQPMQMCIRVPVVSTVDMQIA